jgi:hypothetical protein
MRSGAIRIWIHNTDYEELGKQQACLAVKVARIRQKSLDLTNYGFTAF